jgi:hypothetical protein
MDITIWLQDKCSRAPCGAFAEICDVPGIDAPLIVMATDEDQPRAVRIAVVLGRSPFTVLFQLVLLETSEPTARVESIARASGSGRRVLQQVFQKHFGLKNAPASAALARLYNSQSKQKDKDLRAKLDEITARDEPEEHLGIQSGLGTGEPKEELRKDDDEDEVVDTAVINISTRQLIGRMMIFSVFRDIIGHNMYLRVVMHDPVAKKDSHLTLLHYTTQRLLTILRINRDMLEDSKEMEDNIVKQERQKLRAEIGQMIVNSIYLTRTDEFRNTYEFNEKVDDDDEVEYDLRMRDIMVPSRAAELSVKKKLMEDTPPASPLNSPQYRAKAGGVQQQAQDEDLSKPKSLLQMPEVNLLYKVEKVVCGRRVLAAFYNETNRGDILRYSHNIRVVIACMNTLEVLYCADYHEDTLESFCAHHDKRHLMSAMREADLVRELADALILKNVGQRVTGMKFAGTSGAD